MASFFGSQCPSKRIFDGQDASSLLSLGLFPFPASVPFYRFQIDPLVIQFQYCLLVDLPDIEFLGVPPQGFTFLGMAYKTLYDRFRNKLLCQIVDDSVPEGVPVFLTWRCIDAAFSFVSACCFSH